MKTKQTTDFLFIEGNFKSLKVDSSLSESKKTGVNCISKGRIGPVRGRSNFIRKITEEKRSLNYLIEHCAFLQLFGLAVFFFRTKQVTWCSAQTGAYSSSPQSSTIRYLLTRLSSPRFCLIKFKSSYNV